MRGGGAPGLDQGACLLLVYGAASVQGLTAESRKVGVDLRSSFCVNKPRV
jgi:hypothetical protein